MAFTVFSPFNLKHLSFIDFFLNNKKNNSNEAGALVGAITHTIAYLDWSSIHYDGKFLNDITLSAAMSFYKNKIHVSPAHNSQVNGDAHCTDLPAFGRHPAEVGIREGLLGWLWSPLPLHVSVDHWQPLLERAHSGRNNILRSMEF